MCIKLYLRGTEMSIFSLLFGKNNSLTEDYNDKLDTVETVSSKIEVVYPSGMFFKTANSDIEKDIMDIIVPIAMNILKDNYTTYFTEKLLSKILYNFNLNISLRNDIYLISTGKTLNLELFKEEIIKEVEILDINLISKIVDGDMDDTTYLKIREILLEGFKFAGNTDLYFSAIYNCLTLRFLKYINIDNYVSEIQSLQNSQAPPLNSENRFLFADSLDIILPCKDIMFIAGKNLRSLLSKKYNYDYVYRIIYRIVEALDLDIEEALTSYESLLTSVNYISEIKITIENVDLTLLNMIKNDKIDETTYLVIQEVLVKSFKKVRNYSLYIKAVSVVLTQYVRQNALFKEHISNKMQDYFYD